MIAVKRAGLTSRAQTGCLAITLLMLWLNGLGCALCCLTLTTEECCEGVQAASLQVIPAEPSCCQLPEGDDTATPKDAVSQPEGVRWCSLLPNQESGLTVPPQTGSDLIAAPAQTAPALAPQGILPIASHFLSALPQNRGDTYLRCCVFLI